MNLTSIAKTAIDAAFGIGAPFVKEATYTRPPSYNSASGHVESAEIKGSVKVLMGAIDLAGSVVPQGLARALIRSSEVVALGRLRAGDYFVLANGERFDVELAQDDPTEQVWRLDARASGNRDYGDLTASAESEDFGALTATSSSEDFGGLYA